MPLLEATGFVHPGPLLRLGHLYGPGMSARSFNLADLFELVAAAVPEREAAVAGDRRLSYAELDRRTNQLARHFLATGSQPGSKVAIYSWNRMEWLESFLAAFKARLIPININYRYVPAELAYVLENADAEILVFEDDFSDTVAQVEGSLPVLRHKLVLGEAYESALAGQPDGSLDIERSPDDQYFLYTGGTTGMPKGVMWRSEDIYFGALSGSIVGADPIATPEALTERISPDPSRLLAMAPLMHGAAQWAAMATLYSGNTLILYTGRRLDGHEVCRLAERERANTITLVGDAMARPLAEAIAEGSYDLSNLFAIGSGGAVFSPAVQDELRSLLPNVFIADSFGASETGANGTALSGEARRFTVTPQVTVLDDELRTAAVGSSGSWPGAGTSRSATTRTRPRRRPRSRSIPTGSGGWSPATPPSSVKTALSSCSVGARSASTAAARRSSPKRSRRP